MQMLGQVTMGFLNIMLFIAVVGSFYCVYFKGVKTVFRWEEVEPSMLTSAGASISHGFAQYYTDVCVVTRFLLDHYRECSVCNPDESIFCKRWRRLGEKVLSVFLNIVIFLVQSSRWNQCLVGRC